MPEPDASAVEAALQRGAHQHLDDPPYVLEDDVGRQLVAPAAGWLDRFRPEGVRRVRASQIGRARFVEDFVVKRLTAGVQQYVLLGAGLDSFALRHPSLSARLHVFEVDVATTQSWKQQRLNDLGLAVPPNVRFVPFDFQSDGSWVQALVARGFDSDRPAVVSMLGVSQYISSEATSATMHEVAQLGAGTAFACTFLVPVDFVPDAAERATRTVAAQNLAEAGHPWVSLFTPEEFIALAHTAGFAEVRHVSPVELTARYFTDRSDGLRPVFSEHLVVASLRPRDAA
jgi:methyltransferase (TIGR00027 family)